MTDVADTLPAPGSPDDGLAPAEARKAHSVASVFRSGWLVWYPLLGSLAAWIIHLLAFVSLAKLSTDRSGARLAMHGITAVTLAMVVVAAVLSVRLARKSSGDPDGREEAARDRFIGLMGLAFAVANGSLIVLEELYLNIIRRTPVA